VVEPPARPVNFYAIELLAFAPPDRLALRVACSAGAYIRSLAHDLGLALGTAGYLDLLRREAAGAFTLADAHDLSAIEQAGRTQQLAELLLPLGAGLPLPQLRRRAPTQTSASATARPSNWRQQSAAGRRPDAGL
jgi:tRNA pseudouridine55 synthase